MPRAVLTKAHDKGTADALEKVIKTMTYDDINNIHDPYKLKDFHMVAGVHPPDLQEGKVLPVSHHMSFCLIGMPICLSGSACHAEVCRLLKLG